MKPLFSHIWYWIVPADEKIAFDIELFLLMKKFGPKYLIIQIIL